MRKLRLLIGLGWVGLLCSCASPPALETGESDALVFDPAVVRGRLANGIEYLIRENHKPEDRVELRLIVDAGSVLEDDDQQGLAHFLEHMAFNGTTHFEKNELVDYLESIGMAFGPHLNAYTSFDETVYMLQVPTEDAEILDTGFKILADWASGITMEGEEIDKERGVVIEEWRGRRGARQRIRDKQFPFIFKDSRYAERLPIGKKEILESFDHEVLRRFHRDWYRPELMTVVAVGDADVELLQAQIEKHFGPIPASDEPVDRPAYTVPDQPDRRVQVVGDPEATSTSVDVYFLGEADPLKTRSDYRRFLRDSLFSSMLNVRFEELRKKADAPFLGAYAYRGNYPRSKGIFVMGSQVAEGGIETGLEALLTEAERLKRFGFTAGELERARAQELRAAEVAYHERETTESSSFAQAYVSDVTNDTVSPGIEAELRLHRELLDTIQLAELNALIDTWISETNCAVVADGPEKDGAAPLPEEAVLAGQFAVVSAKEIDPYIDDVAEGPLVEDLAGPAGSVVSRQEIEEIGVHEWTLSNGIRMLIKPTDFKKDEVLVTALSAGGHSMVELETFIPASTAAEVVEEGGAGPFSQIQLGKKLAGKVVGVSPYILELQEGLTGGGSPEDLETLFQLIHLIFTGPREDPETFESLRNRRRSALENRLADPNAVFSDRVTKLMSQGHPRAKPWTPETVDEMDLQKSMEVYRDRFADGDDFVFVFVGNLDLERLEDLAGRYLASLPVREGSETWVDRKVLRPDESVSLEVRKGIEPKATVNMKYWGEFDWSFQERFDVQSMVSALRIRLREAVREDEGGTYGVGVQAVFEQYPRKEYMIQIGFGCDPERMNELIAVVNQEVEKLCTEVLPDLYLTKVKESQLRRREVDLKTNSFWMYILRFYEWNQEDPRIVLEFEDYVNALTAEKIRATAEKYFRGGHHALFTLMPEEAPIK